LKPRVLGRVAQKKSKEGGQLGLKKSFLGGGKEKHITNGR